jgi:hypothetical protein
MDVTPTPDEIQAGVDALADLTQTRELLLGSR